MKEPSAGEQIDRAGRLVFRHISRLVMVSLECNSVQVSVSATGTCVLYTLNCCWFSAPRRRTPQMAGLLRSRHNLGLGSVGEDHMRSQPPPHPVPSAAGTNVERQFAQSCPQNDSIPSPSTYTPLSPQRLRWQVCFQGDQSQNAYRRPILHFGNLSAPRLHVLLDRSQGWTSTTSLSLATTYG